MSDEQIETPANVNPPVVSPRDPLWRPGSCSPDRAELFAAMAKAQGAIEGAKRSADNPHFRSKYADLSSAWDVAREPLSKNGLAIIQWPRTGDNGVDIETIITHSSGQYMSATLWVPCSKFDAQGIGSAITYGRRYALMAVAGIAPAGDDDDGNAAVASAPKGAPMPRQSSAHGRALAADDEHLVDATRAKGDMPADALKLQPAPAKRAPKPGEKTPLELAKEWASGAIGTVNLSGQGVASLKKFWADEEKKITWCKSHAPDEYERFIGAYDLAIERAASAGK